MKPLIVAAVIFALSGIASGVADIASTPAKFNQSTFRKWNPTFEYGEYIGHKDETWVNKWAINESGTVMPGTNGFFLSSTALVGFTDLWHGARTAMMFMLFLGALVLPNPQKWWQYIAYYTGIIVCYSSGWWLVNLALG